MLIGNFISDDGIARIVDALRENRSLEHLFLGDLKIYDAGAKSIAQMLRKNKHLNVFIFNGKISPIKVSKALFDP